MGAPLGPAMGWRDVRIRTSTLEVNSWYGDAITLFVAKSVTPPSRTQSGTQSSTLSLTTGPGPREPPGGPIEASRPRASSVHVVSMPGKLRVSAGHSWRASGEYCAAVPPSCTTAYPGGNAASGAPQGSTFKVTMPASLAGPPSPTSTAWAAY